MWSPEQLMSTCEIAKGENEGVLIENEFVSSSQTSYCTLQWPAVEEMKQSLTIDIVSCGLFILTFNIKWVEVENITSELLHTNRVVLICKMTSSLKSFKVKRSNSTRERPMVLQTTRSWSNVEWKYKSFTDLIYLFYMTIIMSKIC